MRASWWNFWNVHHLCMDLLHVCKEPSSLYFPPIFLFFITNSIISKSHFGNFKRTTSILALTQFNGCDMLYFYSKFMSADSYSKVPSSRSAQRKTFQQQDVVQSPFAGKFCVLQLEGDKRKSCPAWLRINQQIMMVYHEQLPAAEPW